MSVDYDYSRNKHTEDGARIALQEMLGGSLPESMVDIGCGQGTWIKAALAMGINDVVGVDGSEMQSEELLFSPSHFRQIDLTQSWDLGRKFDVAICLEVAEHIDPSKAGSLVSSVCSHSDLIFFSAACPDQGGQHHVNCQWPSFWQEIFNEKGYVCSDLIRWKLWDEPRVEPWYRQNMFIAKLDRQNAGKEQRIASVLHPDMSPYMLSNNEAQRLNAENNRIFQGLKPLKWYLGLAGRALAKKMKRKYFKGKV